MTTALEIIEDAHTDLGVKPSEVDLTDSEKNTGKRYLNRIGVSLAADGIDLGFNKVDSVTETLTIPDWSEDLFISLLAIRLAPSFGIQIDPALAAAAKANMDIVEKRLLNNINPGFPSTLPVGSGNQVYNDTYYFPGLNENELQSGSGTGLDDDESIELTI